MINKIKTVLSDVSLSKERGRYLSDKSYGFDTIYFIAKFILYNAENRHFNKKALREKATKYVEDLFQLIPGTAGAVNYYLESINLLTFGNILSTDNARDYFISQVDILKYIAKQPENAYIFLYLLTYLTLKNDRILPFFEDYAGEKDKNNKEDIIRKIYDKFVEKSSSIETDNTNWSKQLVKYSMNVWGFVNEQNYISRSLRVKKKIVNIEDAALNISGTRTPAYLPKKNDYLQSFNLDYVRYHLNGLLLTDEDISGGDLQITDSLAESFADLKLAMLDDTVDGVQMDDSEKQQYLEAFVKTRNQSVQNQFKKGLLENNDHVCPICGFSFEKFLIASHIKPYAKCDDTYDAINHYNGLLMCPNHDRLFEDARHMTIHSKTGEIILSAEALASKDYKMLQGRRISKAYIKTERKHYLEWHNKRFLEHNSEE